LIAVGISIIFQLPRQHYRFIGFKDFLKILLADLALLFVGCALSMLLLPRPITLEIGITAAFLTGLCWMFLRACFRAVHDFRLGQGSINRRRTLVVGAGRAGLLVADELERHGELGCVVVGFVDDALTKQGLRVHGIPVLGTIELVPAIVEDENIELIVLAIPSASGQEMRRLAEHTRELGIQVKTVPGIFNLLGNQTWRPELRDISIEDLLRREPVQLDQESLASIIEDQVVLITGAGGSIGSELCRQVCRFRPSRIVLLGRGENSLWIIERELRQTFPNQPIALELCDIRNPRRLAQVFDHWRPSVVFHAAAHKHVPFLETHPEEAVENNIFGTRNVLDAALAHQVEHFVNISTDKAVNPTNVLGVSKRMAELLVAEASQKTPPQSRYVSVRFGNVLGSRGSVVPIFQEQIRSGGPLSVTHADMTRYFMTIPEASQLVLQAGLLGETGKVYVLDMGDPVRIVDLARDMIRLSGLKPGEDIEIQFTGMRPGEKLFEELFYAGKASPSLVHPKVYEASLECDATADLMATLENLERSLDFPQETRMPALLRDFLRLVPTYLPSPTGLGKWLKKT